MRFLPETELAVEIPRPVLASFIILILNQLIVFTWIVFILRRLNLFQYNLDIQAAIRYYAYNNIINTL